MATIETRKGKKKTSYRVVWYHRKDKRHQTCDTLVDAELWKALIEQTGGDDAAARRAVEAQASTAPMLSDVAESHIDRLIDITPYTRGKYLAMVRNQWSMLDAPVDTLTEDDIIRWVQWMRRDGRDGEGYSAKSIKNSHGLLFSVLAYAVKRGHRPDNPAADTRLPVVRRTQTAERNKYMTAEEVAALRHHIGDRHLPHFDLLWGTGMRAGELLALTPEDFTVIDGVVHVSVTKSIKMPERGTRAYIGEPKSQRSFRTIDVDDGTMSTVWPLVRAAGHGQLVFSLSTSERLTNSRDLWVRMWEPALRRAQAAGFTKSPSVHSLRHSHASHLIAHGVRMEDVSDRLGHGSVGITDAVYRHRVPSTTATASSTFARGNLVTHAAPAEIPA
ncbi:tyrosine-type recombinase/integrase [Nesterenkonia sphaerica]|uniref:Site-specific integrase n=1 Tax=Nesterenkonia sphaerica TaxID=1804988 RepID=A0A5R9A3E0_9MICC|nr:site-specific integrase [Nesterenkonia sphaerica]TLP73203.1 site-specific integrase [Nesterenkonia sphaerica]